MDLFVVVRERVSLRPLDVERLRCVIEAWELTAGGCDGCTPVDATLLSDGALVLIAGLLSMVEGGAPWPRGARWARLTPTLKP